MRHRIILLSILFLAASVFLSFSAVAQVGGNCAANSLFLTSDLNNAHAGSCIGSSYTNQVNWGSSGTRSCSGSNVVVRLSAVNNAHAELPSQSTPGYSDVCFGNLDCDTAEDDPGDTCVYSLSSSTNANVGECNALGYTNVYCNGAGAPICDSDGTCEPANGENNANCVDCPAPPPGSCPAPNAKITKPLDRSVIDINENIFFEQQEPNNTGCFDYRWDFGDATSFNNHSATHKYTATGQMRAVLTVVSKANPGNFDQDAVDLLIVDLTQSTGTQYILADIKDPLNGDMFDTGQYILFSGNSSFALEITGGHLKCIAGDCPTNMINGDGTVGDSITIPPGLAGFDLDKPERWNEVNFSWDFGDGTSYKNNSVWGTVFQKPYANLGVYTARLVVYRVDDATINGTTFVNLTIRLSPGCYSNGRKFVDSNRVSYFTTDPSFNLCGGLDGNPSTSGDNCCLTGWTCQSDGSCSNSGPVDPCEDICKTLLSEAKGQSNNSCIIPVTGYSCALNALTGKCALTGTCQDPIVPKGETPSPPGSCTKEYTQTGCINQEYILSWIANFVGSAPPGTAEAIGCVSGSQQYPCGRIAKLAFFTFKNSIAVILILAAFYLLLNRNRKNLQNLRLRHKPQNFKILGILRAIRNSSRISEVPRRNSDGF